MCIGCGWKGYFEYFVGCFQFFDSGCLLLDDPCCIYIIVQFGGHYSFFFDFFSFAVVNYLINGGWMDVRINYICVIYYLLVGCIDRLMEIGVAFKME